MQDLFLIRAYDAEGNFQWTQQIHAKSKRMAVAIVLESKESQGMIGEPWNVKTIRVFKSIGREEI